MDLNFCLLRSASIATSSQQAQGVRHTFLPGWLKFNIFDGNPMPPGRLRYVTAYFRLSPKINFMKRFLLLCMLFPCLLSAQEQVQGTYFSAGPLGHVSALRDFGVSPLIYDGLTYGGYGGFYHQGERLQWRLAGSLETDTLDATEIATFESTVYLYCFEAELLYRVWRSTNEKLAVNTGLAYLGQINDRDTPSFLNAGSVTEAFNTLLLRAQFRFTLRRDREQGRTLFLFPRAAGTRRHEFTADLGLPTIQVNWRPGFAYLEDFSDGDSSSNDRNDFRVGGFHLRAGLGYRYYLLNGNAIGLSYAWDYLETGADAPHLLELSRHSAQLNLLFRLNRQ